jgi:hypothetical protein
MTATQLIAQHLDNAALLPVQECDTVCAFSGQRITKGVRLKDAISGNFTDHAYLRYPSEYCAVDIAQCLKPLSAENARASLRNYSFLATPSELRLLKRAEYLDAITQPKELPFVLCLSFGGKKHISYKATPQYSNEAFTIYTDKGEAAATTAALAIIVPIAQRWYSIVAGQENKAQPSTYFTKDEIYTGQMPHPKVRRYAEAFPSYWEEYAAMRYYFNTPMLLVIKEALQKQ